MSVGAYPCVSSPASRERDSARAIGSAEGARAYDHSALRAAVSAGPVVEAEGSKVRRRPCRWTSIASSLAPLLLAACAVGPDFKSPAAPEVERYGSQPLPEQTAAAPGPAGAAQSFVSGDPVPAQWWTRFGSSRLDALVAEAFAASPSAASAEAALRQAYQNWQAQRSGMFPALDASASATRQKIDLASFGQPGGGSFIYNLYNTSVNIAYAPDFFGGVRRGVEAQAAQVEYQRFQLEAAYQTLAANVVVSAVREAQLRQQLASQQEIVADQEALTDAADKRYQLGGAAFTDVLDARSNLATERANSVSLRQQLDQAQNGLAVYLGRTPGERASGDFGLDEFALPQKLPVSLPSELVRQRPDVRAAEARLHAASAEIGVATANLLPQINITGGIGTEALKPASLFQGSIWNIGVTATQPLFRAGELVARRRAALAAFDQSAADYKLVVLQSFQNVADVLFALQSDALALQARYEARDAAAASLKLTERQYALGGVSHLQLLIAQQQYGRANSAYFQALANRYADTAALFQALGGGWWNRTDAQQTSPAQSVPAPTEPPASAPG